MKTADYSLKGLERKRGLFFRIGLLLSLIITFFAFEWRTPVTRVEFPNDPSDDMIDETLEPVMYRKREVVLPPDAPDKPKSRNLNPSTAITIIDDDITVAFTPVDSTAPTDIIPINLPVEIDSTYDAPLFGAEIDPEFPGGEEALVRFIQSSVKYPEKAIRDGLDGSVFVSFVIDEYGKAVDVTSKYASHAVFKDEALRVISNMPRWKPGRQGGKNVKVIMTLPVTFRLVE